MRRSPSVFTSVLWNWSTFFLGLVVMFVLTPAMLRYLGQSQFGIWNLVIGFIGYFELLEFGIRTSLVRTVAERDAVGDLSGVNAACSSSLVFFAGVGLCIILAGQAGALFAPKIFKLAPSDVTVTQNIMRIYSLAQGLVFPFNAFTACLIGRQRYDVSNGISIAMTAIRATLTFLAITHGYGLLIVALIHGCSNLLGMTGMAFASRRITPGFSPSPFKASKESFKKLARLGGGLLAINISLRLVDASWLTLAGMTLSMTDVAHLSVAMAFARYLSGFVDSGVRVMVPYIGSFAGDSEPANQSERIARATRLSLSLTMLVAGIYSSGVCLFGNQFMTVWLGGKTASQVSPLLPLVMAQALCAALATCSFNVFLGIGRLGQLPLLHFIEAGLSIGLGIYFCRQWGLKGLPLGTLTAMCCVRLPSYVYILHVRLGRAFIQEMLARVLGFAALYLSVWLVFQHFVTPLLPESYPGVLAGAACYASTILALSIPLVPGMGGWLKGKLGFGRWNAGHRLPVANQASAGNGRFENIKPR